ncbi:MAG TPA: glycosyltransferase family 4 protein [Micropepsaceae bacterium]|nr:glycosyltransferase family 4 protein [Micropepsaceae bacterium]
MSKVLFSATDVRPDLQQAARALYENSWLGAYYTTFALAECGIPIRATELLDRQFGLGLAAQLRRRAIVEVPPGLVKLFPWWEIPRTLVSRANLDQRLADALFRRSITGFDRYVARRINGYSAVYAGNGAAYETFLAARKKNIPCIYSVRSFHPAFEDTATLRELENFPILRAPTDKSASKVRQLLMDRRGKEWAMSDLVILNSKACRDSHEQYGLDVKKACVIPLGFPEIGPPRTRRDSKGPLKILWAGNFSILKGAHYFIRAIQNIVGALDIEIRIFGKGSLPVSAIKSPIDVRATIPKAELLQQYRWADVLVHPTLADGYGMAVAEAMSQGLPAITTDRAGISELIRPGETGLVVTAGDSAPLAAALCWCAENRESLGEMGHRARIAASLWQWSHYRFALNDAISGLMERGRNTLETASLKKRNRSPMISPGKEA